MKKHQAIKKLLTIVLFSCLSMGVSAQVRSNISIPQSAFFYDKESKGVDAKNKAAFYRVLAVGEKGEKMFYDYYMDGRLKAEKRYIKVDRRDDKKTILTGVCRTFYPSGKVESVMTYKDGKANGRAVSFFPNGEVGIKLNYTDGVLDGMSYTYNEWGKLEYTTVWQKGQKLNEYKGGADKYIDPKTKIDLFCVKYKEDEKLIISQANSLLGKVNEDLNISKSADTQPIQTIEKQAIHQPSSGQISRNEAEQFSFQTLYELLTDEEKRTNNMDFFDEIGGSYGLTLAQTIIGYGAQKELAYSHNMYYDAERHEDVVSGSTPRQIGFFGVALDRRFTLQRINLYTSSSEEMLNIAEEATKKGYRVLGNKDFRTMNGNFVLEDPEHNKMGDPLAVVLSFTHLPNVYSGLYHIRLELK